MEPGLRRIVRSVPGRPALEGEGGTAFRLEALDLARRLPSGSVDLIYADPPFGTGRLRRSRNGGYEDPGGDRYLRWLAAHFDAFHRLLSDRGSLFVHLDWRAAPHARLTLDRIFGSDRLVNEIVWAYRTGGVPRRRLARKHDTILFYAKTDRYTFHRMKERSALSHTYGYANVTILQDEEGPYRETYLRDVWEIPALRGNMRETTGYPTQKPVALLERILRVASSPGDLVFDPFTGSGTAACAAERLGRRWIACDVSAEALSILRRRVAEGPSRSR